jgi:diguanylate cyclase (GGDEF)-like protein
MMTGGGRESIAIRAFRMGVSDYLPKTGLRPEHFVASVMKVVERSRQESLSKIEYKRLVAASGVDAVTGLEGWSRLEERLNQLALLPPTARASYALILIEFLEYQHVTEHFGLKIADQSLRAFGKRVKELCRSNDVCGRYSEATFLVIIQVDPVTHNLEVNCQRLADKLSFRLNFDLASFSVSACVAGSRCLRTTNSDETDALRLLEPAATMLAQAKAAKLRFKAFPEGGQESTTAAPQTSDSVNSEASATAGWVEGRPAADQLRATDRRRQVRQRVFKRGLIHLLTPAGTFNCTVRNLSSNGAGLRIDDVYAIPETFDLEIAGSGEKRRVRLRWQTGVNIGVEFVNTNSN